MRVHPTLDQEAPGRGEVRGSTPDDAQRLEVPDDLWLRIAQTADEQFAQLANRIKGQGETVQGELIVTSISGIADLLVPVMAGFQAGFPDVILRFLTDMRLFRLDYGEAHVAIRAGAAPEEPDNVVQPLVRVKTGLYAARSYVEAHGLPAGEAELAAHRFIAADSEASRAPFYRWLRDRVPETALACLAASSSAWRRSSFRLSAFSRR